MLPSRSQWKRWSLPSKLTAVGAYVGAVGVILTIWFAIFPWKGDQPGTPSQLELVEASVDDLKQEGFPELEFKVRNVGGSVAFLKEAVLDVSSIEHLEDPQSRNETHVDISWKYDVSLRLTGAPYAIRTSLSQSVKPNDVDRFVVRLSYEELKAESLMQNLARSLAFRAVEKGEKVDSGRIEQEIDKLPDDALLGMAVESMRLFSIVIMTAHLVYDGDNRRISTQPMMFIMPKVNHFIMATSIAKPNAAEIVLQNKERFNGVVRTFTGIMSPGIKRVIDQMKTP